MENRPPDVPRWYLGGIALLFVLTVVLGALIVLLLLFLAPSFLYDWSDGR